MAAQILFTRQRGLCSSARGSKSVVQCQKCESCHLKTDLGCSFEVKRAFLFMESIKSVVSVQNLGLGSWKPLLFCSFEVKSAYLFLRAVKSVFECPESCSLLLKTTLVFLFLSKEVPTFCSRQSWVYILSSRNSLQPKFNAGFSYQQNSCCVWNFVQISPIILLGMKLPASVSYLPLFKNLRTDET